MNLRNYLFLLSLITLPLQGLAAASQGYEELTKEKLQEFNSIIVHYEDELKKDPNNIRLIIAIGDVYYSLKEYPKAVDYYRKALALDPQNPKIKTALALAYLNNNNLAESYALLEEVFKVEPRNPVVIGSLGRIEALEHHLTKAEILYHKALGIDPNHFTTLYYLGELRIEQKNYNEAKEILGKLSKEDPHATWVKLAYRKAELGPIFEEVEALEKNGNYEAAVSIYKQEIAKDPNNLELNLGLSRLYTKMGNFSDAIALLKQQIKLQPTESSLKIALGFTYLAKKDLRAAEVYLKAASRKGSGRSAALAGLGRIAALNGDNDKAEELYQSSISADPLDTLPLSYLAELRMEQKRYEEAGSIFKKIVQLDPNAIWAKQAIEDAKIAPLIDEINQAEKDNNFAEASALYKQLIFRNPESVDNYVRFGNFYERQKRYKEAIELYKTGLSSLPNSLILTVGLGNAYLLDKDFDNSRSAFQFVLTEQPKNIDALAGLGRIDALTGNSEEALKIYLSALKIDPNDITVLSYLADLMMDEKNYEQAQTIFEKIIQINPKAAWAKQSILTAKYGPIFSEIKEMEKKGDVNAAILKYEELLKLAPDSEDAYLGLGSLYTSNKHYPEAIALYLKGLKLNPDSSLLLSSLGLTYLSMGDVKKAKMALQLAYKNDNKNVEAIAGIGKIASLTGDDKTALKMYQTALQINANSVLALSYLADLMMSQKEYEKAQEAYEKIIQIDPHAEWAKIAIVDAKQGPLLEKIEETENAKDYVSAEAMYKELIEESPERSAYYVKLGKLLVKMKRDDEAIALYQRGLLVQPDSTDLKIALAYAYCDKKDFEKGKEVIESVLKNTPNNAEALAAMGKLEEKLMNPMEAESLYRKALKADPGNITALIYLSQLMTEEGHYDEATKYYNEIYRIDPASKWIKQALIDAKHGRLLAEIKKKEEDKENEQAEFLWNQLLLEEPNDAYYYLRAGLFLHKILQYNKAIEIYLKGIKIDPKSSELYAALGLVYISKKNFPEAHKAFTHSLKLDPKNADALAGLGYVLMIDKEYTKAEELIKAALAIDPERIAALSAYGELLIREKRYPEAVAVYEKLHELRPKEKWISLSLDDAKNGPEQDAIMKLVKADNFSAAADVYKALLQRSPDNPRYYVGLGQMYMRLREYSNSIAINREGLEKNPDENELRVALGYALFFNQNLGEAREVLTKAVEIDAKEPEALAGLGRVNVLEENYCTGEALYRKALAIEPKNLSALTFLGDLLLKEKRYEEAQENFALLKKILPDAVWIQRSYQDAIDGPVTDIANRLSDMELYELAASLYRQLLSESPNDPARYLPLGQMYVNMHKYCCGIQVFEEGLEIDEKAWYLWRAMAATFVLMEDYCTSTIIYNNLLEEDAGDVEAWAGLGRIQALNGDPYLAMEYYQTALEINPRNLVALSYLSDLLEDDQYNFSALEVNDTIVDTIQGKLAATGALPKWARRSYSKALNLTCATITGNLGYHQEKQWDPIAHTWSAKYSVAGGKVFINYPICDTFDLWGSIGDQFYALKDLETAQTLYSFDVQRYLLGSRLVGTPTFYMDVKFGVTNYSPYKYGTFTMLHGNIIEPSVTFVYHRPTEKATFSLASDSDLVARDFSTNQAKMVGYYWLGATYETKVMKRVWVGFETDFFIYNDFVYNSSERGIAWFQWNPPVCPENVILRYMFKIQSFAQNIPDYYTYTPQVVNQLQITLQKNWRACWADTLYTSLSYAHGWQDTRTRYAQIVVVPLPPNVLPPLRWDIRQYDMVYGNLIYGYDQLQITLNADYYRDTEKYTMWSVAAEARWRF